MQHIANRIAKIMEIRELVIDALEETGMDRDEADETLIAQYVTAAVLLEVDASINATNTNV